MVVNKPSGSITLFSFDEDEGLSEHTAPYDAVVTILDGECEVWVAGETHRMHEGETIIFPANVLSPLCITGSRCRDDVRV
jgi:quercetin dioxygenase-like cupin family protein